MCTTGTNSTDYNVYSSLAGAFMGQWESLPEAYWLSLSLLEVADWQQVQTRHRRSDQLDWSTWIPAGTV